MFSGRILWEEEEIMDCGGGLIVVRTWKKGQEFCRDQVASLVLTSGGDVMEKWNM